MQEMERRMAERAEKIKVLRDKMNTVEDEVFIHFCIQIGVDNIRYGHIEEIYIYKLEIMIRFKEVWYTNVDIVKSVYHVKTTYGIKEVCMF